MASLQLPTMPALVSSSQATPLARANTANSCNNTSSARCLAMSWLALSSKGRSRQQPNSSSTSEKCTKRHTTIGSNMTSVAHLEAVGAFALVGIH
ncbi:hypothetical protein D9M73_237510 [compost metagenome]